MLWQDSIERLPVRSLQQRLRLPKPHIVFIPQVPAWVAWRSRKEHMHGLRPIAVDKDFPALCQKVLHLSQYP